MLNKKNILKKLTIIAVVLFIVLSIFLKLGLFNRLDNAVSEISIGNRYEFLQNISIVIGYIFEAEFVIPLAIILAIYLLIIKRKKEALFLLSVFVSSGVLVPLTKFIFARLRPTIQFVSESGYSFPSGHSLIAIVLLGSLAILFSKKEFLRINLVVSSVLAILGGVSRIYLNVHWLTDILGGILLGIIILSLAAIFFESSIYKELTIRCCPKQRDCLHHH